MAKAERHELRLDVAVDHAELLLDRVERAGGDVGLQVGGAEVARPDRPDLAGALEGLERVHGLGDRRRRVLPVGDVEVDVVGAEAAQARVELVGDRVASQVSVHRLAGLVEEVVALVGVPDEPALRRQHHLVAPPGDGLADDLLRPAHAIGGRGVDQRHPGVDRRPDRRDRRGLVGAAPHPSADGPGAEADRGGADAGAADFARLHHVVILFSTSFAVASSSTIALTCRPRSAAQIGPTLSGPAATPMLTGMASSSSGLSATRRAFSS